MKKEGIILGGIGLVTLIIVIVAAVFLSGPSSTEKSSPTITDTALLLGDNDQRQTAGSPSAKVTIVEFADFQCPACGAANPIVKKVIADYQDKIYFVFRNFPLPMHPNALVSAEAAYAAGTQGKFWEMESRLYESQLEWSEKSGDDAKKIFLSYAEELGLDVTKFSESLDSKAGAAKIQKDQNDGYQLGVDSTPTFFINGEKFSGSMSYDQFKKLIDDRLN